MGLFVSLATALLATSWGDGEIILLDGSRIAVQRYEIKEKHIVFMTVEGKLQSLPLVYVDLLATTGKKEFSGKALTRQPNSNLRDQSIDYHNSHLERTLLIQKVQSEILLDAVLDEADWDYAPVAKNFIQSEPVEGKPATYDTEVRVLYDENHLYFGVLAYDSEPNDLVITDLTRDYNTRSVDTFGIVLDTFHDRRNSYMFQTNPAGSKFDGQSFNEGQVFNRDWDGVWHVKARVTEQGWIAEFAIPLKTLKFRSLEQQTWGVNFLRRNRRLNEDSHWAPIPRIHTSTRVSIAGTLKGLRDLKPGTSFRVSPYARGDAEQNTGTGRLHELTGGVDAKIGVGTGLTLDLTVNTDFSEIESDIQQVNLSRFSLFFPEKRDFFF